MGNLCKSPGRNHKVKPEESAAFRDEEKEILKRSWELLSSDMTGYGLQIMVKLLSNKEIAAVFKADHMTKEEIVSSDVLRRHATRFMQALQPLFDKLDNINDEQLGILYRKLGMKHVPIEGFDVDYFTFFVSAIHDVLGERFGKQYRIVLHEACDKLVRMVIEHMKDGINQELFRRDQEKMQQNGVIKIPADSKKTKRWKLPRK